MEVTIELDTLADQTLKWQKVLIENFGRISSLEMEKKEMKKSLEYGEQLLESSKEEICRLLDQVNSLQSTLAERCNAESANRELKDEITALKKKEIANTEDHKKSIKAIEEKMAEDLETNRNEMEKERKLLKKEAVEERSKLESLLEDKCAEMAELTQVMKRKESDKLQMEISKLRLEYESRLAKVKQQTMNAQQSASFNTCKDIFRKKWENAKTQYEEEITQLRAQIMTLEQRLGRQNAPVPIRPQPAPRPAGVGARGARGGGSRAGIIKNTSQFQPFKTSTPNSGGPVSRKRKS